MSDDSAQRLERFPPFQAMGIKVLDLDPDWQRVRLLLPLNEHNVNPGGTMFGGAMAALADPIAALACAARFTDYTIWTKSLSLDFISPGRSDLQLLFEFPPGAMDQISAQLADSGGCNHTFHYGLYLDDGALCCRVTCVVALRSPAPDSHRRGFRNTS